MYRQRDVENVLRIKKLLYEEGYTIAGARQHLKAELKPSQRQEAYPSPSSVPATASRKFGRACSRFWQPQQEAPLNEVGLRATAKLRSSPLGRGVVRNEVVPLHVSDKCLTFPPKHATLLWFACTTSSRQGHPAFSEGFLPRSGKCKRTKSLAIRAQCA